MALLMGELPPDQYPLLRTVPLPSDPRALNRTHLLKVPPPPNALILGTNLPMIETIAFIHPVVLCQIYTLCT
jgi:hypothetical protein